MNRNKIMEWLRQNGWGSLKIDSITEYSRSVSVMGDDGDTCVHLDIKKSELDQIELRDGPEESSKS